jgi:uncharacterized membrane protein YkoI
MMRSLLAAPFALALLLGGALGAARAECLAPGEARRLVASGEVVPLVAAARAARASADGEMIGGRLCNDGLDYVYVVTFLGQDGRVSRVTINARNGDVLSVR